MVTGEGGLKKVLAQDEILCQPRDNMTLLFLKYGDMISMEKKGKIPIAWFGNFVYHMHNFNKMVTCRFCGIKGLKNISSACILRKWKKVREPPVMIRRPNTTLQELVMQRQSPLDAMEKENKKR
jgi:hypothetical protein